MEIHIGNRVAEVELVSKEDNKVVLTICLLYTSDAADE